MNALRIAACLLLTLAIRLCAQYEGPTSPPPPPAAELAGATASATWSPGHWRWTGSQWSWCPGSWRIARAAASAAPRWIEGHWVAGAAGTAWVPGRWQDDDAAGSGGTVAAASGPDDGATPPSAQQQPHAAVSLSPVADQTVYVGQPYSSGTVICAPACTPLCAPPPAMVGVRAGRPLRLPLPPFLPLPFASHHGSGSGSSFGRLPLPFFNPLSLLFHHR